jgi:hypothetical protein
LVEKSGKLSIEATRKQAKALSCHQENIEQQYSFKPDRHISFIEFLVSKK